METQFLLEKALIGATIYGLLYVSIKAIRAIIFVKNRKKTKSQLADVVCNLSDEKRKLHIFDVPIPVYVIDFTGRQTILEKKDVLKRIKELEKTKSELELKLIND